MKKYIYKITNRINNKVYIGQTNNIRNRWNEHKRNGSSKELGNNYKLYNAMNKYGINIFDFEIIEGPITNYNEREKYWISFYNSFTNGYNMTIGGEDPPILKGENSCLCKYSDEIINNIQKDLIENLKSFDEISKEYNISKEYLSIINRGFARYNSQYKYPLRKANNSIIDEELVWEIIDELMFTTKCMEQIQRDLSVDSNTIYHINNGRHRYSPKNIKYPIRKEFELWSEYIKQMVIKDLKDHKLKIEEIAHKYNISRSSISKFNNGKIYKINNIQYPIRNSKERVYS